MQTLTPTKKAAIHWNLATLAQERGMNGAQIARQLGLHKSTVCLWLKTPSLPGIHKKDQVLERLCQILDCDLSDLIEVG